MSQVVSLNDEFSFYQSCGKSRLGERETDRERSAIALAVPKTWTIVPCAPREQCSWVTPGNLAPVEKRVRAEAKSARMALEDFQVQPQFRCEQTPTVRRDGTELSLCTSPVSFSSAQPTGTFSPSSNHSRRASHASLQARGRRTPSGVAQNGREGVLPV